MKKIFPLFLIVTLFGLNLCYAQRGKDGAKTITTASIVNEFTSLTADVNAGSTSLFVVNSTLNTNGHFNGPLVQGDLIMIIQMQGATIVGNVQDSTWGDIVSYNNCGLYEFSEVADVPDTNTISLTCGLRNNYNLMGKVQVVRIPRYSSLTINNGGVLTGDKWNGTMGGIIAAEVQGGTQIDSGGAIDATGIGFRGGVVQGTSGPGTNNVGFASDTPNLGGAKGEGIAGFRNDYSVYGGMFGRGAAANAGGGGDQWNASGGGGANAGDIAAYNGNGNPDVTTDTSWATAWNLEGDGFANSTSSGGGRGGYTIVWFPPNNSSPLVYAPGNNIWGPNSNNNLRNRENVGGKGGRPLDYSAGRIFAGGGGGAGHEDQGYGGSGGAGGGIVYLLGYGTVNGEGIIVADGENGRNDSSINKLGDAVGGGGAGGAVIVYSTNTISGISAVANGGPGGNQYITSTYECEGPGGGGGGGYIAISNGNISTQAIGGNGGITSSPLMTLFPPDGATKGGDGLASGIISFVPISSGGTNVSSGVSVCSGDSVSLLVSGGTNYTWNPSIGLSCADCPNPKAAPDATTTYAVSISSGACSSVDSVTVTVLSAVFAGTITGNADTLCIGGSTQLTVSAAAGNIQWQSSIDGSSFSNLSGDTSSGFNTNSLNQTTYFRTMASGGCGVDSSQAVIINVIPLPTIGNIIISPDTLCAGSVSSIKLSGASIPVQWQLAGQQGIFTDIPGADSLTYTTPSLFQSVNFRVIANNGYCTDTSSVLNLTVNPAPVPPSLSTDDSIICSSDSTLINTSGSYSGYLWNNGDAHPYTYAKNAGGYWVSVTDANGCTVVSSHLNISVYQVPSVSITVQGDTLTSFGASAYQWNFNGAVIDGADLPVYIAQQPGDYSVQITDTNGCKAVSSNVHVVISAVNELGEKTGLNIYPNPFADDIFIDVNDAALHIESAAIYNITGQKLIIKETGLDKYPLSIDVSVLPKGAYLLQLKVDGIIYLEKLIKE